jgi:hypothetical protein
MSWWRRNVVFSSDPVNVSRSALNVALSGVSAGGILLASVASAQDEVEPAGPRIVLNYGVGLEVDTNDPLEDPSPGTYAALVNQVDLAFLTNTRTQSFALTFSGDLNLADDPPEEDVEFEFRDPTVGLSYSREAANSRLALSGSVRVRDVDTLEPFFVDTDGDTIIDEAGFTEDDGTATITNFGFTLETRRNAPISTTYTAAYSSRTYSDTDDPDLYDREDFRVGATTRLRFSGVSQGQLTFGLRQYEYSEGRDLLGQSGSIRAGIVRDLSPTLTVEGAVGYALTREDEEIAGESFEDTDEGLIFDAAFRREVINGEYFGEYDRELIEDTFRNTLVFGRSFSLQNSNLRGSLGLTALDGGDPQPVFNLFYARETQDGQFTAGFRRTVTLNTDDEERVLSAAVVGYSHEINTLSSFRVGLDYALITNYDEDDVDDDEERATITASYNRALTRDWGLTVGYRGRAKSTETEDAISNSVFVNLGRQFIFRP